MLTGFLDAKANARGRPVGVAHRQARRAAGGRRCRQHDLAGGAGSAFGGQVGTLAIARRQRVREVRVNLAYRWFCGLSIEDKIPGDLVFSQAGNERIRDNDVFGRVFERCVGCYLTAEISVAEHT